MTRLSAVAQRLERLPLSIIQLAMRIAVGAARRLATLPLLGMIAVIPVFVYPNAWSDHLLWASGLLLVLTRGPGFFSLDHAIVTARRHRLATASVRASAAGRD